MHQKASPVMPPEDQKAEIPEAGLGRFPLTEEEHAQGLGIIP
jgi:hypothetical protein